MQLMDEGFAASADGIRGMAPRSGRSGKMTVQAISILKAASVRLGHTHQCNEDTMARPLKKGLSFWSKDTDFYADPKVRKMGRRCGASSLVILDSFLCKIYHEGYYITLDEDMVEDIADETFTTPDLVLRTADFAVQVGFFHEDFYRNNSVLTGLSLQQRYFSATSRRQKPDSTFPYLLLNFISADNNPVSADNNPVSADNNSENKIRLNKNTYSSSYSSIVDKEKEEEIFLIFYLKNIKEYKAEVRKFVKFYSDRGWKTTDGEPVTDVLGLANAWDPKGSEKLIGEKAATMLSELNNELRVHGFGISDRGKLRDVERVWFEGAEMYIQCSQSFQSLIEDNMEAVRPVLRRYARNIHYAVKQ